MEIVVCFYCKRELSFSNYFSVSPNLMTNPMPTNCAVCGKEGEHDLEQCEWWILDPAIAKVLEELGREENHRTKTNEQAIKAIILEAERRERERIVGIIKEHDESFCCNDAMLNLIDDILSSIEDNDKGV